MIFNFIKFKGEKNDNFNGNSFTLKCIWVTTLVFLFCWILDLLGIFIVDLEIMNVAIIGSLIIAIAAFIYALSAGIDKANSRYVIMFALIAIITVICTEMSYHTTLCMIFPLICSAQYFDKKVTYFTFSLTCVGYAFAVLVGYKIGLCDANMILLTKTTCAKHIVELVTGNFVINNNIFLIFLFFVFPKWLIMFAVLPLLNHVTTDIQIRTDREAIARHQAEIDGLTGLYNRSKYKQMINEYYTKCVKVSALFFDVNDLKITNDTKGHEYGDILLLGLSEELQKAENENRKCFRIGGDEFIMILENDDVYKAESLKDELNKAIQGKPLENDLSLSVAIGIASGKGEDIEKVIKVADENMYLVKQAMKAGLI